MDDTTRLHFAMKKVDQLDELRGMALSDGDTKAAEQYRVEANEARAKAREIHGRMVVMTGEATIPARAFRGAVRDTWGSGS